MNIYDIAREAGVSIATVSRILNGKETVSPKTKKRVEEVLKAHNYMPNDLARGLVVNSIRTVGVMVVDIRNVYYANVAYTVEQELSKLSYNVILCNTGNNSELKVKYMRSLMQKKVDGIILVGSVFKDNSLNSYISDMSKKIPIVVINCSIEVENVYSVMCDEEYGAGLIVDYIVSKGRRNPVHLHGDSRYSSTVKRKGFHQGMIRNGLTIKDYTFTSISEGLDGGYEGVKNLIKKGCSFDAVLCGDDLTAIGAINALKEQGIKVPDEVSVTGFDNSIFALCSDPLLTTVDSMMEDMGNHAVNIFSKIMAGEKVNKKTIIQPELVIRTSG